MFTKNSISIIQSLEILPLLLLALTTTIMLLMIFTMPFSGGFGDQRVCVCNCRRGQAGGQEYICSSARSGQIAASIAATAVTATTTPTPHFVAAVAAQTKSTKYQTKKTWCANQHLRQLHSPSSLSASASASPVAAVPTTPSPT